MNAGPYWGPTLDWSWWLADLSLQATLWEA